MENSNNSSQGSGSGKSFTKQIAEGARDLLNAGRDIGLLFSGGFALIAFITALESPETLTKWIDAARGRTETTQKSSSDKSQTKKSDLPSSPAPKFIVIRDTVFKEISNETSKEPIRSQVTKEDTVIFKMGHGREYPFKASRPNGKLELEIIAPTVADSVSNPTESNTKIEDADLTMVSRYEEPKVSHQPKVLKRPKVWKRHLVGPGDILRVVAKKYGVTLKALMEANNRKKNHATQGELLNIPYPENYFTLQ